VSFCDILSDIYEIIKNKNKLKTFVLFLTYRGSTGEKQGETIQVSKGRSPCSPVLPLFLVENKPYIRAYISPCVKKG
jgi:hypothetical protein